jgi:hypothetical protein
MCLRRAPEKYIAGAALDRAALKANFPLGTVLRPYFHVSIFPIITRWPRKCSRSLCIPLSAGKAFKAESVYMETHEGLFQCVNS